MKTHEQIDRRSLILAQEVVARIDADPAHSGIEQARNVCSRWARINPSPTVTEWQMILSGSWGEIRAALLDASEEGNRIRQNNPFCGVISPRERWQIYRRFRSNEAREP